MSWRIAPSVFALLVIIAASTARSLPTWNAPAGPNRFAATDPQAFPIYTRTFTAVSGRKYWVRTASLTTYTGFTNVVDTVVRVLNTSNNTVVANDDDVAPGQRESDLEFTASSTFTAMVVVHAYLPDRFGRADVLVNDSTSGNPGTVVWSTSQAVFGGFGTDTEVRNGDRVFSQEPRPIAKFALRRWTKPGSVDKLEAQFVLTAL